MSDMRYDYLALGAGLSGLAAGKALQAAGRRYAILEACPTVGGLTRTVSADQFCFDYTGHLLHLARYGSPSGIPYADLRDDHWERIGRQSFCLVDGEMVPSPIQYNMAAIPSPLREECVQSYHERPAMAGGAEASFQDFVISGFGQRLSEVFLIPQNEKTQATRLDRLSTAAVKRFFPAPDTEKVQAGIEGRPPTGEATYNSRFWYPRVGGIQALVDGFASGQGHVIHRLREATRIDVQEKTVHTRNGERWGWEQLLSSIPLDDLCRMVNDEELNALGRALTHSSTVAFNLGLRSAPAEALRDVHWVYVPQRDIPFYRVGVYSNLSPGMCPSNMAALYVEIGVPGESLDAADMEGDLYPRSLEALEGLGWIDRSDIVCVVSQQIRCAYVHHTPAREKAMDNILRRLHAFGVFPMGRYGTWDYTSMEDSISSGIETAETLL